MKAPTNVYGPGGELVRKGETVPAEWFDLLPDLRAHLDNVERAPDPQAAEVPEAEADPTPPPAKKTVAPKKVKATATLGRERRSS